MTNFKKIITRIFSRSAKKVIHSASDVVSKSPEVDSLAKTLIERGTNYVHAFERVVHFHLVVFGIIRGLAVMTTIIALGKLSFAIDVPFLASNQTLISTFAYASFFISIFFSFIKHYKSKHHERRIHKSITELEEDFKEKHKRLELRYKERADYLEKCLKDEEDKLDQLRQKLSKKSDETSVWETISSYNPIGTRKTGETDHD